MNFSIAVTASPVHGLALRFRVHAEERRKSNTQTLYAYMYGCTVYTRARIHTGKSTHTARHHHHTIYRLHVHINALSATNFVVLLFCTTQITFILSIYILFIWFNFFHAYISGHFACMLHMPQSHTYTLTAEHTHTHTPTHAHRKMSAALGWSTSNKSRNSKNKNENLT